MTDRKDTRIATEQIMTRLTSQTIVAIEGHVSLDFVSWIWSRRTENIWRPVETSLIRVLGEGCMTDEECFWHYRERPFEPFTRQYWFSSKQVAANEPL